MKEKYLLPAMAVGVFVGTAWGWVGGEAALSTAWIGDLFLDLLRVLVLPLIFCSMVDAVAGLYRMGSFNRIVGLTFSWYLATTVIAVTTGLVVVSIFEPGVGVSLGSSSAPSVQATSVQNIVGSLFTDNLFEAAVSFKVLPVMLFALVFGLALSSAGERAESVRNFFGASTAALLRMVHWLMFVAPLGIAALLDAHLGKAGGGAAFFAEVAAIGKYCFCVVLGLGIHGFIVLPVLLKLLTGRSPFRYAYNLGEALLTAFSTASSSATLALTMDLSEKRNSIRSDTASFVLPLGATVNMDGTALYEAVAVMFIAQATGIEVSFGGQVLIVVTATLASVGAAGIPQAGLVTMVLVLEAVGLPADGISAILAVDWLLDRFRTTVNVWGDAVGAGVVDAQSEGVLHGPV